MTRKHFIVMADAILEEYPMDTPERDRVIKAVCEGCRRCNPRFDAGRFYRYICDNSSIMGRKP